MVNRKKIEISKKMLIELGNRLHQDIQFCKEFIKNTERADIEKEWMKSITSNFNYSCLIIQNFIKEINNYDKLDENQFSYYVGKIAIQHLLEMINSYELITKHAIENFKEFKKIIEDRINKKITELIKAETSPQIKKYIEENYKRKIFEMAFIRDTLKKNSIINDTDISILKFAWDIRNSMHSNFLAIKDIDFKYSDIRTGKKYYFKYSKNEELYHQPGDLLSFYIISEQIMFIMLKTLQKFSLETEENPPKT